MALVLAGCGTEVLYSNLEESDANKILGLLMARDISGNKVVGKENKYSVLVPREDFAKAVDLLEWYGVPKKTFSGVGEVFQKTGMVSTPTEEFIRFTFALSQDIAKMLSHIDGVITSSVQLVLPQNDPYTEASSPSSASVFLKFRPGDLPAMLEPQVKQLVMNSVQGLTYEKVAVTVMQSENVDLFYPIQQEQASAYTIAGVVGGLVVVLAGAAGYLLLLARRKSAKIKPDGAGEDGATEDALLEPTRVAKS